MATPTPSSSLTWHLPPSLAALLVVLDHALAKAEWALGKLPGSAVVQRYVRSSYKDDPGRAFLEFVLFVFAVRTLLQSRTRADGQRTRGEDGVHYIRFDEKVRWCQSSFKFNGPLWTQTCVFCPGLMILTVTLLAAAYVGDRRACGRMGAGPACA